MILHWDAAQEAHAKANALLSKLTFMERAGNTAATDERVALYVADETRYLLDHSGRMPTQARLDDATVTTLRACWRAERWIFEEAFYAGRSPE